MPIDQVHPHLLSMKKSFILSLPLHIRLNSEQTLPSSLQFLRIVDPFKHPFIALFAVHCVNIHTEYV